MAKLKGTTIRQLNNNKLYHEMSLQELAKHINYELGPGEYNKLPGDYSIDKAEALIAKWNKEERVLTLEELLS